MKKITTKGDVTIDTTAIQKVRDYYEQLHTSKLNNLEEMDKCLETHNLLRLNHEEIENLKRSNTSKGIKSVIKNLLTKFQNLKSSLVNSIKYLKKD